MEKKDNSSNAKLVWIILLAVTSVLCCYLFFIVYFYNISPYNISAKLTIWPFHSSSTKGQMYLDTMVEITISVDEDFSIDEKSLIGVNIRRDGWILAPANSFDNMVENSDIQIKPKSGKIYMGKIVVLDKTFNLALIKCENVEGESGEIKIPFASIGQIGTNEGHSNLLAITVDDKKEKVLMGYTDNKPICIYGDMVVDYSLALKYCFEDSYLLSFNAEEVFSNGLVFNEDGAVLGLCNGIKTSEGYMITPTFNAYQFLDKAFADDDYQNQFADKFYGIDAVELQLHKSISESVDGDVSGKINYFYFDGKWYSYAGIDEFNSGFMIFNEFEYGEVSIEPYSVIKQIQIGGKVPILIENRTSLQKALYQMKSGDKVVITYLPKGAITGQSVTFVV